MTQTMTDTRMTTARTRTGEANIIPVRTQLSILRERGILIDINVTGTNLFKRSLSWLESGILVDGDDDRLNYFTKGSKYVWDEAQAKELMSVVTQMRQLLAEATFNVTGFYPFRYMPFTAHAPFVTRWETLSARFYAIKVQMIANRQQVVDMLADRYALIAEDIFKSLTAKNRAQYIRIEMRDGSVKTLDRTEWVSFMVENTVNSIPTEQAIEDRLHCEYITGLLYTDVDNIIDGVGLNTARQDMLTQNNNDPRVTAMLNHEAGRLNQTRNNSSPLMEVFSALRSEIAEAANEIIESIGRNSFIHGKVAQKARGLLAAFDRKAAHNDEELRNLLVALKEATKETTDETRNVEAVRMVLDAIVSLRPTDVAKNAFSAIEI